jgi:hypothetical protein
VLAVSDGDTGAIKESKFNAVAAAVAVAVGAFLRAAGSEEMASIVVPFLAVMLKPARRHALRSP